MSIEGEDYSKTSKKGQKMILAVAAVLRNMTWKVERRKGSMYTRWEKRFGEGEERELP